MKCIITILKRNKKREINSTQQAVSQNICCHNHIYNTDVMISREKPKLSERLEGAALVRTASSWWNHEQCACVCVCGCVEADLRDALQEGFLGQFCRAVQRLAIVLGAPARAVNMDVLGVEAEGVGLHHICHLSIQHTNPWRRNTGREGGREAN